MEQNNYIPQGYPAVCPYIIVTNATAFIQFLQDVFNGTVKEKLMRDEKIVQHAEVVIDGSVIMLADAIEGYPPQPSSLFIYVPDADAAYQKALSAGATSIAPLADREYGRTCGITDPMGNTWWITAAP